MAKPIRRADRRVELGDWRAHYSQLWNPMTTHTKPADRMPLPAFVAARQALRDALATFESVKPNCRSCAQFEQGRCKQFDSDIPAEFQQQDEQCTEWIYDGIPF